MPRHVQSLPSRQCTRLECCVSPSMGSTHPQAVKPPYLAVLQADHRADPVYAQVHRDDDAVQLQDAVELAREGPLQALWGRPTPYRFVVVLVQGAARQTQTGLVSALQAAGVGKWQRGAAPDYSHTCSGRIISLGAIWELWGLTGAAPASGCAVQGAAQQTCSATARSM